MPTYPQHTRPNPDDLLVKINAEEARQQRGRLKVFFGAAAGVGKTFAMLSAGRAKAAEGIDIVVGYAEPHARTETEALLLGLELLPTRNIDYRGTMLREFDLDAALARKPELIIVDELAHTNAPGSRHEKRWQDIDELLEAGINVFTTLNVQHLESLNDVVAQVTGVIVRETLPDHVFEKADEVELVDLAPDELLERLAEGKVYIPRQAEQAADGFFRKANLIALRELSLRKTADRVGDQVLSARREQSARSTWPTAERLLVCVSPSKSSARVIRAAKRLAVSLHAEWIAAHVETPRLHNVSPHEQQQLLRHFRLAEHLGAQTVTLTGHDPSEEIVSFARSRNITKIIVGKPTRPWWIDLFLRSHADRLMRKTGDIDLYIVRGIGDETSPESTAQPTTASPGADWRAYAWSSLTVAICSLVVAVMVAAWHEFDLSNLVMVYLVGVVFVAARYGRAPSAFASILSVAAFDFFFVPPTLTFAVSDTQYLITFLVMLGVALLIGTLTVRLREQADAARAREQRTETLYRMAQQLADSHGMSALIDTATRHIRDTFHARAVLLLPDENAHVYPRSPADPGIAHTDAERAVAQWTFKHRRPAGRGTDTLPSSESLYLPLVAAGAVVGVLGIQASDTQMLLAPEQRQLLDAFSNQIALAIERDNFAHKARTAQVQVETEKLRSTLLSSVSHDLRTPLAVITGASSSLLHATLSDCARNELIHTIHDESDRLTRLVGNLLDITKLESGNITLNKQWHSVEEIVGSALHRLDHQLTGRNLTTHIPDDLPLIPVDGVLLEQALFNLLDNAINYSPPHLPIDIAARTAEGQLILDIADHGPGLAPGEERRVFEKFYRGQASQNQRGSGLGLPICRAIVEAHSGRIWALNATPPHHGATFRMALPLNAATPPTPRLSAASDGKPTDV